MLNICERELLLKKLQEEEIKEHVDRFNLTNNDHKNFKLNTRTVRFIRDNFDIEEYTIHFYDDDTYPWEEMIKFNNWIDVDGPGIWSHTQEEANDCSFRSLLEKVKHPKPYKKLDNTNRWHIFFIEDTLWIFYFGRHSDTENYYWVADEWWIYRPKNEDALNKFREKVFKKR